MLTQHKSKNLFLNADAEMGGVAAALMPATVPVAAPPAPAPAPAAPIPASSPNTPIDPTKPIITPPITPMKEKVLQIDDFDGLIDPVTKEPAPKSKTEVKDGEGDFTPETDENPPETQKLEKPVEQVDPNAQQPLKRDYSVFTPEEAALFKKGTHNAVYDYLKVELPKLRSALKNAEERVRTSNALPTTYYEHPKSYVLSPQYTTAVSAVRTAEFEENHWAEQFARIEAGETSWKDLDGYDAQGRPIITEKKLSAETLARTKADVLRWMNSAAHNKSSEYNTLRGIVQSHQTAHSNMLNGVKEIEERFFKNYADPKHPRAGLIKTAIDNLPDGLQTSPLAPLVAKSYATILDLIDKMKEQQKELETLKTGHADRRAAGPKSGDFNAAGAATARTLDISEFNTD